MLCVAWIGQIVNGHMGRSGLAGVMSDRYVIVVATSDWPIAIHMWGPYKQDEFKN